MNDKPAAFTSNERCAPWRAPSNTLPPRGVPVLCAWRLQGGWSYGIAKWTGKRWLDVIPETANEQYNTPAMWQEIVAPGAPVPQPDETRVDALTDKQCDQLISELEAQEWSGISRDDVRLWDGLITSLRFSEKAKGEQSMTDEQIKYMVTRFLAWRLPANFTPDAGISFKAEFNEHTAYPMKHEPSGTNLFDATQAEAMVRHMVEGMPGG